MTLPLPGFASSRPTGVVRARATAAVATVAGWLSENSRRGPLRRTRVSFGMPPAVAGVAAASAGGVVDVVAPGLAAGDGAAVPAAGAAGPAAAGVTVTVPCMPACQMQTYVNVPGWVNVCWKVPAVCEPESKGSAPEVDVTLCWPPCHCHVTVSP